MGTVEDRWWNKGISLYERVFMPDMNWELYNLSKHTRALIKLFSHDIDYVMKECPATVLHETEDVKWRNNECEVCLGFLGMKDDDSGCPCTRLGCDDAVARTVIKLQEGGWL
jgi:hypothetical protein